MDQRGRHKNSEAARMLTITNVMCRSWGYVGEYAILAKAGTASAARWYKAATIKPAAISRNKTLDAVT